LRRFEGKLPSMGSDGVGQEWRNKAIAPYGPGIPALTAFLFDLDQL